MNEPTKWCPGCQGGTDHNGEVHSAGCRYKPKEELMLTLDKVDPMDGRVTPNELELLMHFYVCPEPHQRQDAPAVLDAIQRWLNAGMLRLAEGQGEAKMMHARYRTTARAAVWIEHILKMPLPEQEWVVPERPEEESHVG